MSALVLPVIRRNLIWAGALALAVGAGIAVAIHPTKEHLLLSGSQRSLERWTVDLASTLDPDGPYRDPTEEERSAAGAAMDQLLDSSGRSDEILAAFAALGFETMTGSDPQTGRGYLAAVDGPDQGDGWGVIIADRSAPITQIIEVPHPRFDINTEVVGLAAFRECPGSVLIMAGSRREAADSAGDVAHNAASMFNVFATSAAERRLTQFQLHGFADDSVPDTDVVVSTGSAASSSAQSRRLADALEDSGMAVCRAWVRRCGLEGTTNVQGQAAAATKSPFVHVEMSYTIRASARSRAAVVNAVSTSIEAS